MAQTSKHSPKERTGVDRLYKRVGVKKVSFYYQYPNGASETFATAPIGDRNAIAEAERDAKRKAMDIQQGVILAGSVADMIERFKKDIAPAHYLDQSKDGKAVREGTYSNLIAFFGKMQPKTLRQIHGFQYIEARAKAKKKAIKELALLTTICHYAVQWGLIEINPFVGMRMPKVDKAEMRAVSRRQIVRFYLWAQKQESDQFKTLGCAALFCYLTGYRAAEVRPFHTSGLTKEGVRVLNAKRKKGELETVKLREWSMKLRAVVKRAKQARGKDIGFLFSNRHGKPYVRSGWGSVWQDAQAAYLDCKVEEVAKHPEYFTMMDIRPAAITTKMKNRDADVYDFAAHGTRATTDKHYDRRKVKRASATE